MWAQLLLKLKIKKGISLIEVMCSITIFSVMFLALISMQVDNTKLKKANSDIHNYSLFMEEIKNNLIYNCSYFELQKLGEEHRCYISKENIEVGLLKERDINSLFIEEKPIEKPYVEIYVEQGKVLRINLKLYIKAKDNEEVMECEIYKGSYKR